MSSHIQDMKLSHGEAYVVLKNLYDYFDVDVNAAVLWSYLRSHNVGNYGVGGDGPFFLANSSSQIPLPWREANLRQLLLRVSAIRFDPGSSLSRKATLAIIQALDGNHCHVAYVTNGTEDASANGVWQTEAGSSSEMLDLLGPASFERYVLGMESQRVKWCATITFHGYGVLWGTRQWMEEVLDSMERDGMPRVLTPPHLFFRPDLTQSSMSESVTQLLTCFPNSSQSKVESWD